MVSFEPGGPEECTKVENIATPLFRQDGPYIEQLLEGIVSPMLQEPQTNLKQEVRENVYNFMYPEEYTQTESITASYSIGERDSHSRRRRRTRRRKAKKDSTTANS